MEAAEGRWGSGWIEDDVRHRLFLLLDELFPVSGGGTQEFVPPLREFDMF